MINYSAEIIRYSTTVHTLPTEIELKSLNHFKIKNPLCGDEVTWYYQVKENKIKQLYYYAAACLICKAATHICHTQFKVADLKQLSHFIKKYSLITDNPKFEDTLSCFIELQDYPNRRKCVTLPYLGLNECLLQN